MPDYKLYHFNTRFLAEPIRLIFAYADVPYEDIRVSVDDWKNMKDKCPWGQLPMLELSDGRTLGQSSAIAEFLAKKFDLVGNDQFDQIRCNEVSDSLRDIRQDWRKVFFQKNRDRKIAARKMFIDETIPKYFQRMSEMQEENGGLYLICDRITYADLLFAHNAAFFEETVNGDVMQNYPKLKKLQEHIYSIPRVREYLDSRIKTDLGMLSLIPVSV